MQGETIFLSYRIAYPPNKGDKIRAWHILRHLLAQGPVHIGALVDDEADLAHVGFLQGLAASSCFPFLSKFNKIKRVIRGFLRGMPLSMAIAEDDKLTQWLQHIIQSRPIARIILYSGQMGIYILPYLDEGISTIIDFVDVDSEKWSYYARNSYGLKKYIFAREARLLRAREKYLAQNVDASLFVSETEADLFSAHTGLNRHKIHVMSNGVDSDYFNPALYSGPDSQDAPLVVFTGAMDYKPNIEAMLWFKTYVWPLVRAGLPHSRLQIVGSSPVHAIKALHGRDGIEVTGRVADVRPFIAKAHVAVAPLQMARGIQNKVLESMAMARAVVTTPHAFEGIKAEAGHHLLVEETAAGQARAIIGLIDQPALAQKIGSAARAHVVDHYHWRNCLCVLDQLLSLEEYQSL